MTTWPYADRGLRFGLLTAPSSPWPRLVEHWQEAEALGFDSAWVIDHLMSDGESEDQPNYEGWTLLAGLAAVTSRLRLGVMVSGNTYRNPALLAKQAVTVDHISGGRLTLGLGAGWFEREHQAYGFELPGPGELVDRFAEALEVIDLLQRDERASYDGRYYRLDDAPFQPRPLQQPRLPLLIGGRRPRMLALAARHADVWNTRRDPAYASGLVRRLDDLCHETGRDPATLVRSVLPTVDVFTSVDAVRRLVADYRAIGFTDFVFVRPGDPEQLAVMRRAATEVFPELRTS